MNNLNRNEYRESVFTGTMFELLGVKLVSSLINGITLYIAYPWVLCWRESWLKSHTYINGRQLCFDGTGMQLIGNWLKWLLFSVVTFGIYLLWIPIKIEQWRTKHTFFADEVRPVPVLEPDFNPAEWIRETSKSITTNAKKLYCRVGKKLRSASWTCSNGHLNKEEYKFCTVCGETKPNRNQCPNCGSPVSDNAKFCGNCAFAVNRY